MSGVGAVLDAVGFGHVLATADLVVTGEGRFDWQSLRGKVVVGVAEAAGRLGIPAIAIPGQSLVGRREAMTAGLSGVYAVAERPQQVADALADPVGTLVGARCPGRPHLVARAAVRSGARAALGRGSRRGDRERGGDAPIRRGASYPERAGNTSGSAWVVTPDPRSTT